MVKKTQKPRTTKGSDAFCVAQDKNPHRKRIVNRGFTERIFIKAGHFCGLRRNVCVNEELLYLSAPTH